MQVLKQFSFLYLFLLHHLLREKVLLPFETPNFWGSFASSSPSSDCSWWLFIGLLQNFNLNLAHFSSLPIICQVAIYICGCRFWKYFRYSSCISIYTDKYTGILWGPGLWKGGAIVLQMWNAIEVSMWKIFVLFDCWKFWGSLWIRGNLACAAGLIHSFLAREASGWQLGWMREHSGGHCEGWVPQRYCSLAGESTPSQATLTGIPRKIQHGQQKIKQRNADYFNWKLFIRDCFVATMKVGTKSSLDSPEKQNQLWVCRSLTRSHIVWK